MFINKKLGKDMAMSLALTLALILSLSHVGALSIIALCGNVIIAFVFGSMLNEINFKRLEKKLTKSFKGASAFGIGLGIVMGFQLERTGLVEVLIVGLVFSLVMSILELVFGRFVDKVIRRYEGKKERTELIEIFPLGMISGLVAFLVAGFILSLRIGFIGEALLYLAVLFMLIVIIHGTLFSKQGQISSGLKG